MLAFLSRPDLIRHVHWNDNYLYDFRGRKDSHAALDHGTLPYGDAPPHQVPRRDSAHGAFPRRRHP